MKADVNGRNVIHSEPWDFILKKYLISRAWTVSLVSSPESHLMVLSLCILLSNVGFSLKHDIERACCGIKAQTKQNRNCQNWRIAKLQRCHEVPIIHLRSPKIITKISLWSSLITGESIDQNDIQSQLQKHVRSNGKNVPTKKWNASR